MRRPLEQERTTGRRQLGAPIEKRGAGRAFRFLAPVLVAAALGSGPAAAQTAIPWWTIDGGGARSTGGAFALSGTIGQPDVGGMIGGGYSISGGFWNSGAAVTAVEEPDPGPTSQPLSFRLFPPSPNPVLGRAIFRFDLAVAGETEVRIYDVGGRLERTLLAAPLLAGSHEVVWDGTDDRGRRVSTGVHFVRLASATARATQKIMVLR